ncbi:MAG: hypothetical protein H0T05_03850 [Acidobacteria bacterium]|nr:hypothetical protein [Acidobacteriota bacterium]MBA3886244.1 hypothetical protein [Acidobacteriota bacterium]
MGRVEADALRDGELVYLAASLGEARQVEELLTGNGVDYVAQVEELGRTTLFGSPRHGAGFYVPAGQAQYCRSLLAGAGLGRVVTDEPEDRP